MANLFNVTIKPIPTTARKAVKAIIMQNLGPDSGDKAELLMDKGGTVFSDLNDQAANYLASQLQDAGATASVELSNNIRELFRVRLLSFGMQKIQVIKQVRDITGLGLKESKELVEANGVVKENIGKESATKIMEKLAKAGATSVIEAMLDSGGDQPLADDSYFVNGRVDLDNGEPAKGVLVRAYDKDLRSEQLLGEATTTPAGEYTIPYTPEQFKRAEKNNADLLLRVFNEVGVELALKTEKEDQSDIYFNSPKQAKINLQLKVSEPVTPSEYEHLQALLNPALDGTILAELSLQDIQFLIQETEIVEFVDEFPAKENSIHFIAQSTKLTVETSIPAEAFYGWARLDDGIIKEQDQDTLDLNTLLDKSDKKLRNTLEQAIEGLIIPAWLTEQLDSILRQINQLREEIVQEEKKSWTQHQVNGILVDENSAEPLDGYVVRALENSQTSILNTVQSITNAQGEFVLSYALPPKTTITQYKLQLIIEAPGGEVLDEQNVEVLLEQPEPLTLKVTVPAIPEPGEALEITTIPMTFSTALNDVLKVNEVTNIADLRKLGGLKNLQGVTKPLLESKELKELQAHVDLSLLGTDLEPEVQLKQNQLLIKKGFNSFIEVAAIPVERFVSTVGGDVSSAVWNDAARLVKIVDGIRLDRITGASNETPLERDPALSCKCEDCVSALSPGAYLTDLIGYVTKNVSKVGGNEITLDFLVNTFHQPLSKLPINCEATKTQVRQVRIACEVLYKSLLANDLKAPVENEGVKQYRKKAYQALLRNIGTSHFALQRASSEEEIESIANRMGIAPEHVQTLKKQDNTFNHVLPEEKLEGLFGLPAFIKQANAKLLDPLRFLNNEQKPPLLYDWRLEHLQKQWKESDFPENPLEENTPIIEPDVIGPDDFRNTDETNTAFSLWKTRRKWVDKQVNRIHKIIISNLNKPQGLETALFEEMPALTTIDDLISQHEKLAKPMKSVERDKIDQWLKDRHLSTDALTELARIATDVKAGKEYSNEEWETYTTNATNILVDIVKRASYKDWIEEENGKVSLDINTFWASLTEPKEGEWSGLLEQQRPLIDPEKIEPKDLPDGKFGLKARDLWEERRKEIDTKQKEYSDTLKSKEADRLTTIMSDAFGSVPDLEAINTKLNNLDPNEQLDAKTEISALNLDEESFRELASASLILEDEKQTLSDTVLNNLSITLASAHKLNFLYERWDGEEAALPYWKSLKARLPKWRASQSRRQQWQQALRQASQPPLVDPDTISGDVLLEPVVGNFAFDTWRSRTKLLETKFDDIQNLTSSINTAAFTQLTSLYLGITVVEFLQIADAENNGQSINKRLEQLTLSRGAYLLLLEVAQRLEDGKTVLDTTWENIYHILLQVWKLKQFATWRAEEKDKLSLSPEFFKHPKRRPIFTTQQDVQRWRIDTRRQREWYRTLKGRIQQQETLSSSLKTIVSDVEEQTLPLLRDALIEIIDDSNDAFHIKAEKLTKRFLIGMQIGGCQMTTRISMALEILQVLVFSIRSGKLKIEDKKLTLQSKIFEKEWKWMGSYATWKAAMGVFLYPEKILYPSLRRDKTPLFKSIEESLRTDTSSKNICEQTSAYFDYLKDIISLKPIASCYGLVNINSDTKCSDNKSLYKKLLFAFSQGGHTNSYYWSSMDPILTNIYSQSFWEKISFPDDIRIEKMVGAFSGSEFNNIYVYFESYEEKTNKKSIIYCIFNLDINQWDSTDGQVEVYSVKLSKESYSSIIFIQGALRPSLLIKDLDGFYMARFNGDDWFYYGLSSGLLNSDSNLELHSHSAQIVNTPDDKSWVLSILISTTNRDNQVFFLNIRLALEETGFVERSFSLFGDNLLGNPNQFNDQLPVCSFMSLEQSTTNLYYLLKNIKTNDLTLHTLSINSVKDHGSTSSEDILDFEGASVLFAIPDYDPRDIDKITLVASITESDSQPQYALFTTDVTINSKGIKLFKENKARLISLIGHVDKIIGITQQKNYKLHINDLYRYNRGLRLIHLGKHSDYLKEGYFFIPLQVALILYKEKEYKKSLWWFRYIFDYKLPPHERRISYTLKTEKRISISSYERENWINDPLNPHSFKRKNKYNLFVIQKIVRCLLDYADSEFTYDTSESVARARSLYQTALDLIQSELPPQLTDKCQTLINVLDLKVKDKTLQPYYDYLKVKLGEFTRTDVLQETIIKIKKALIQDNTSEEERLSNALQITLEGLGEKPPSLNVLEISTRSQQKKIDFARQSLMGKRATKSVRPVRGRRLGSISANASNSTETKTVDITNFSEIEIDYTPNLSYEFCIPNNPTAKFLLLRVELNLFKIRNCMNIAGMQRELEPYAAPIDVESALPSMEASGQINLPGTNRIRPTQYRYPVLVDRAKQLASLAQQTEASFFSASQSRDQEKYGLFKARQDVELSREGVKLQKLRVRESEDGVDLAELQLDRTSILEETYAEWFDQGKLERENELLLEFDSLETAQLAAAWSRVTTQGASLLVTAAAGGWDGAIPATIAVVAALTAASAEASAQSYVIGSQNIISELSLELSFELRQREYELQRALSVQDLEIGNQQIKLANDRVQITEQEQTIAEIQSEQASDTVTFLQEKFTNVELYDWMSGVLEDIFRYYLQQGASMSKLAEIQLAFERQEPLIGVIKNDYYELANSSDNSSGDNESSSIDRRGLTGSARLLRDITKLDQYAFTTDQRKQQLAVNFSLSQLDPFAFQQFKQTGILNFDTSGKLFDRRFPGQYLRLIKRVRISVVALVPPVHGISATLTSSGISRVVIAGDIFQISVIRRDPESIVFTNPMGATGIFELNPNPEMLLPFEGNGVDMRWEFRLPKASNPMDFNTIADVLLTIEYTALHNRTYQEQVQRELDTYTSFDRAFSFRQEFSDAWYDLHNPDQTDTPMSVGFETTLADFPSNVKGLTISSVLMYFVTKNDLPSIFTATLTFTQNDVALGGESAPIDGVISTTRNGTSWVPITGKTPEGSWRLELPNTPAIKMLFDEEKIDDILLVLTCDGELPGYS